MPLPIAWQDLGQHQVLALGPSRAACASRVAPGQQHHLTSCRSPVLGPCVPLLPGVPSAGGRRGGPAVAQRQEPHAGRPAQGDWAHCLHGRCRGCCCCQQRRRNHPGTSRSLSSGAGTTQGPAGPSAAAPEPPRDQDPPAPWGPPSCLHPRCPQLPEQTKGYLAAVEEEAKLSKQERQKELWDPKIAATMTESACVLRAV